MIKTILTPTDGSDHAKKAVALAAGLAQKYDAKLILLNVMRGFGNEDIPEGLREYAQAEHMEAPPRGISWNQLAIKSCMTQSQSLKSTKRPES